MKIFKIFAASALIAATAATMASCDGTEEVHYSPAPEPTGQRVYFSTMSETFEVPDDATPVTIDIHRPAAVSTDAYTVQLITTDASGLFKVPTDVTFAAGDSVAVIPVEFEASKLEAAVPYRVVITVDEAQANEYGISTNTLTVTRMSWTDWEDFGTGVYIFSQWYEGNAPAKVQTRHLTNDKKTIQYRFMANFDETDPEAYELYLEASTSDGGETISVPEQIVGFHPSYGDVYLADIATYTGDDSYADLSYFDPVNGLFTLYLVCYCDAGVFGDGNEYCQLDGYADNRDYKLELVDGGAVEIDGSPYAIVRFEMNENITEVKYTVTPGQASEEEIGELVTKISEGNDSIETKTVTSSGNVAIAPSESGEHTLVAVGFNDDGEAKASASIVFDFGLSAIPAKITAIRLRR